MNQLNYLSGTFFSLLLVTGLSVAEDINTSDAAEISAAAEQSTLEPAGTAAIEQAETQTQATEKPEPLAKGSVARSAFATDVQDHEPVDQITALTTDTNKVYFFTELIDLQGQRVVHRWEREGEVVAEVPFQVGGARWRVWSSKNLQSDWVGDWTVSIVNGSGDIIQSQSMQYKEAPKASDIAKDETAASSMPIADTTDNLKADESISSDAQ
jgi:hypothetical protein